MTSQIVRSVWASGRANVVLTCEQSSGGAGIAANPAKGIIGRLQLEEAISSISLSRSETLSPVLNFLGALQQIFWRDVPRLSGPRIDLDHMRGEERQRMPERCNSTFLTKDNLITGHATAKSSCQLASRISSQTGNYLHGHEAQRELRRLVAVRG